MATELAEEREALRQHRSGSTRASTRASPRAGAPVAGRIAGRRPDGRGGGAAVCDSGASGARLARALSCVGTPRAEGSVAAGTSAETERG